MEEKAFPTISARSRTADVGKVRGTEDFSVRHTIFRCVAPKKQSMTSIFSTTNDQRRCDEISGDEIYGRIFGICACVVFYKGHIE